MIWTLLKLVMFGPTKEAIRAIILYKSAVTSDDNVVDVGCGTGGITCEFAQRAKK